MKVTLDLTRLLEEGRITQAEYERLRSLAAQETGSVAINVLIGFGVVAVASGAVALVPNPLTGAIVGAVLFAAGLGIELSRREQWRVLAQICIVTGGLMVAAGFIALDEGRLAGIAAAALTLAIGSVLARSSLLMAAAVLALGACLGARTSYTHASYHLAIYEPTVTIVLFSALAMAAYGISKRLPSDYERIALTAARTSVLLVNFGFWIGSLWGDRLQLVRALWHNNPSILDETSRAAIVPDWLFIVGWAIALFAAGLWGARVNRRWVVNVAAVFGAIHFYTQWFEKLGANPATVLVGGLLMLGFALALWSFNRNLPPSVPPPPPRLRAR